MVLFRNYLNSFRDYHYMVLPETFLYGIATMQSFKSYSHCFSLPVEYITGEAPRSFFTPQLPNPLSHVPAQVPFPWGSGCTFQEYPGVLLLRPTPEQGWLFPRGMRIFAGVDQGESDPRVAPGIEQCDNKVYTEQRGQTFQKLKLTVGCEVFLVKFISDLE